MPALEIVAEHACWGGVQGFYRHESRECASPMRFSVFRPPQAAGGPVPVLYWLAGLTCTEETFMIKAGAQRLAARLGLMLVAPDTSPREPRFPGDDASWDLGLGAGFYVDASQAPWSADYRLHAYVTPELPEGIDLMREAVPIGLDDHGGRLTSNITFVKVRLQPGETLDHAIARGDKWVSGAVVFTDKLRVAWEPSYDYDPDTGLQTLDGARSFVLNGDSWISNRDIVDAEASLDQRSGIPEVYVAITLTPQGGERFRMLTAERVNQRIAIVLNGRVNSAPVVRTEIGGGRMSRKKRPMSSPLRTMSRRDFEIGCDGRYAGSSTETWMLRSSATSPAVSVALNCLSSS